MMLDGESGLIRRLDWAQALCYHVLEIGVEVLKMANITLKIDEELLRKARRLALRRKTTINAVVRKGLEEFVSGDLGRESALKGLEAFFQRSRAKVGARTWTRDELHER